MRLQSGLSFAENLRNRNLFVNRSVLQTLQVNLGWLCNQACHHCHVEAGPKRTENMNRQTVERVLNLLQKTPSVQIVDLTGGAPELNPNFRWFIEELSNLEIKILDRCNLTVFFEKGQENTPEFLARHQVQVVASLPCYLKENVEKQRGNGVFDKSIRALKHLNHLGYGNPGSGLILNLVYNPVGPVLPPEQTGLQADYKEELLRLYGIYFNELYTITNMPIKRFLGELRREKKLQEYQELLLNAFNPSVAQRVMCRSLVSVSWDGYLYDCDFNQMLEIPIGHKKTSVWGIQSFQDFSVGKEIAWADHCYGCTAGTGSSCGGSLGRI